LLLASATLVAPVPPYAKPTAVPCQAPDEIVPTDVKLDAVTPEPSVVALRTDVPLILNSLPVNKLRCSEEVHESVASTQLNVLSVFPLRVIPPPSALASVGDSVEPSSKFLYQL